MQNSISDLIKGNVVGLTARVLSPYFARVTQGGGIYEAPQCVETALNSEPLLGQASLVLIPSGYKEDVVYSEIPIDGSGDLQFTRSSNGTRVNSAGLVEVVPWNLVQYSEDFTNAVWVKSRTTITSNATNAPNGTLTADKFIATSASGVHTISQSGFASGAYSFSVYAKAGEETVISLWLRSAAVGATFDLSAGTVSGITVTSATITDVGDGWYRCFVYDSTPGTTANIYGRTGSSYVGNGVDGFFIWGAQLNIGSTAKPYFPTTDRLNVPRLTYQNGGGGCPALLLEPQRTNLALYSEDFTNGWSLEGATISSNTNTAPDGNTTADRISESAITDVHRIYRSAYVVTSGTTYTYSLFVLKGTSRYCRLSFNQSSSASIWAAAQFDLDTLTFTSGVGSGGGTFSGATISQLPNSSWIRITISASLATTSAFAFFALSNGTAISSSDSRGCNSYLGSTSNNLIIWGAQLELGAYATTIIPTTTASATRIADSFSRNNIYTNGLITSSGGTWFVELRNNIGYTRDVFIFDGLSLIDSTNADGFIITGGSGSRLAIRKSVATTLTSLYTTTTDTVKIAIKWNGTSADIFVNGTKVVSATSFTATTSLQFLKGNGADVPKFIQQMDLFPTPLTDAEAIALTTL